MPEYSRRRSVPLINKGLDKNIIEEVHKPFAVTSEEIEHLVTTDCISQTSAGCWDSEGDISGEEDCRIMTRLEGTRRLGMADIFDGVEQSELAESLSSYFEQKIVEEINKALPRRRCAKPDIFEGMSGEEVSEIRRYPAEAESGPLTSCLDEDDVAFDVARVLRTRRGAVSDVLENVTEMEHERLKRIKSCAPNRALERSGSVIDYSYARRGANSDIYENVEEDIRSEFLLHYRCMQE